MLWILENQKKVKNLAKKLDVLIMSCVHATQTESTLYTVKPVQTTNLYMKATHLGQPILSPPKQIPLQLLLYKMNTCLMQPATTFFVSKIKKNLSKINTTELYLAKKWKTIIRQH